MKFRKHISKLLALGILTNNIYFSSSANTEIPNRYETLEGEYITIDDSTEGELHEIEIFGDTWQDDTSSKNLAQVGEFNISDGEITAIASNNSIRLIGNNYSRHYFEISLHDGFYTNENKGPWDGPSLDINANGRHVSSFALSGTKDDGVGVGVRTHCDNIKASNSIEVDNIINSFTVELYNIHGKSFDITISNIQVEKGASPTEYEEYHKADLSNIQSVGDLYIDDEGNPILDSQGREQYKIDITSSDDINFMDYAIEKSEYRFAGENTDGSPIEEPWKWNSIFIIPIKKNQTYILNQNVAIKDIYLFDNNDNFVRKEYDSYGNHNFSTDFDGYAKICIFSTQRENVYFGLDLSYQQSSKLPDITQKKNTIILPTQLQKVGDIADRLYWDDEKGRYVIEKNIDTFELNESYLWQLHSNELDNTIAVLTKKLPVKPVFTRPCVNNKFPTNTMNNIWGILSEDEEKMIAGGGEHEYFLIRILKNRLETPDVDGFKKWLSTNPITSYFHTSTPSIIETNITSKLKIPTYDGKTHIYVDAENGINPTLKVTVDRLPQVAKNAVLEAETTSSLTNISLARMYVNMLSESLYKDQLQEQLNQLFSSDMTLDRNNATASLDVYIKSENMLSMSLDTNSVSFDNYSGVSSMEIKDAVGITISSSLPYSLNAYMPSEITSSDGLKTIPIDTLNIKEGSKNDYQTFTDTTNKLALKEDCAKGNGVNHSVDLKLDSNDAHIADIYKTVIKFEAEQK